MVQIGNKTLVFSATFPLENNQSASFIIPQFPEHKFEIQVREKPEIEGVVAGTILPKFVNGAITLPVPFVKKGEIYASSVQHVLMLPESHLHIQVFAQGFGQLVRIDVSLFELPESMVNAGEQQSA